MSKNDNYEPSDVQVRFNDRINSLPRYLHTPYIVLDVCFRMLRHPLITLDTVCHIWIKR